MKIIRLFIVLLLLGLASYAVAQQQTGTTEDFETPPYYWVATDPNSVIVTVPDPTPNGNPDNDCVFFDQYTPTNPGGRSGTLVSTEQIVFPSTLILDIYKSAGGSGYIYYEYSTDGTNWYSIPGSGHNISHSQNDWGNYSFTLNPPNVTHAYVRIYFTINQGQSNKTKFWVDNINFQQYDPPLPVELSSFLAQLSADNYINLTWVTQTETGVLGFYILRNTSPDLESAFTISNLVPATNTSQQQTYIYKDSEFLEEGTYYYWLQNSDLDGSVQYHGPVTIYYSPVGGSIPEIPLATGFKPVFPNPFNPRLTLPFSLADSGNVEFKIYNSRGQLVRIIDLGTKAIGNHSAEWNGRDDQGRDYSSGTYHIRMTTGTESFFRKAVLLK
ncbi:MAG: FlgD immunoglobulin-like domain containing protein [Candidatus Cloacimonetes bacterium]|nr:FlgD immunoglobulin-like domain containing protein [Candidatus Cloacimonadota bacterium]